jgi:hypothetical protein
MGIEPTYQAWEARVLPLNYTRKASAIVQVGVEMSKQECLSRPAIFVGEWPSLESLFAESLLG